MYKRQGLGDDTFLVNTVIGFDGDREDISISAGDGDNSISSVSGIGYWESGSGSDTITFKKDSSSLGLIHTIRAGDNDDEINIETDSTVYYVYGEEGNDTISLTGSDDGRAFFYQVLGGGGNDTIEVSGETNYQNGSDVVLIGNINGGDGNDLIDISSTSVSPTGSVLRLSLIHI